ncbi:serine hydrolase domain-containing protein [Dyadobacter fermentans]|nr:serine hydrolase [Dyadobacter fermentans]
MKLKSTFAALSWIMLLVTGCSSDGQELKGIWHAEFEAVPGLKTALDIQLNQELMSGKWTGRFELPELMAAEQIPAIHIDGPNVMLDLGAGTTFKGEVSGDRKLIKGILHIPNQQPENLSFTKTPNWSAQIPARADAKGKPLKAWTYQAPVEAGDGWASGTLEPRILQSKPLNDLLARILEGKFHGLDALLVAQDGRLVLEEYFYLGGRERLHSVQSVTKSVTSLLVGMARDKGLIKNLDSPLRSYFPNYTDSLPTITSPTLRNALTMSAALDWKEDIPYSDPENDAVRMNQSDDLYQYVLSKKPDPTDKPGERFEYNSGLSILLGGILLHATGKPADSLAKNTLFRDLGINHFAWTTLGGKVHTGGGLFLRPRDLLKIGQLVLDKGQWNSRQIVSEAWINESTAFILPTQAGNRESGYGYQWWRGVAKFGSNALTVIYAAGYGGQMLYIVPDLNLVAVTLHHNQSDINGSHSITWKHMQEVILPAFQK